MAPVCCCCAVFAFSSQHACRQLLAFVTGSDRVPINGLGALHPPFVIHRNGDARCPVVTACHCRNVHCQQGSGHAHPAACPAAWRLLDCRQHLLPIPAVTACQRRTPASMPSCSARATRTRQLSSVLWRLPLRTRRCAAPVCLRLHSGWHFKRMVMQNKCISGNLVQLHVLCVAGFWAAISYRSAVSHGSCLMATTSSSCSSILKCDLSFDRRVCVVSFGSFFAKLSVPKLCIRTIRPCMLC